MDDFSHTIADYVSNSSGIVLFRIVASLFFLVSLFIWLRKKNENDKDENPLPPGPKGLPLIGHIPLFTKVGLEKIMEWKKKYGDIYTFKLSGYRFVVLANYEYIKEALLMQGVNFSARTQHYSMFNWSVSNSGIVTSESQMWREHKRFMMTTLRDFGLGKMKLEGKIIDVAQSLTDQLEKLKGKQYDIENLIANCTTNIICNLLYSQTYSFEEPEFREMRKWFRTLFRTFTSIESMRPRLLTKFLPWILIPGGTQFNKAVQTLLAIIDAKAKEHEETYDENHIRDYMDAHISKRKQAEAAGDKKLAEYFSRKHLSTLCSVMMTAAIDTTPSTMYWGFYYLSNHPQVQKKIQKELDEVVGEERLPSFNDLPNLPYTEAVINEILRMTDIVPLNILHENFEDAVIGGYKIPKRSVIIPCLNAIHRDPKYWSDPQGFNPEHFLNSQGKKVKKESFLPFSLGRRLCPGESLARMEMFFFVTMVMQKFDLKYSEDQNPFPGIYSGVIRLLMPYKIVATPREQIEKGIH